MDYLQQVRREDRLADKVADLLKKAVLSGQLRPGDRLPAERALGDRFGVSRTVVREAIRSLTAKGLVEVRSGSGSVVARVTSEAVSETIQLYLQGAALDEATVDEVRSMLDVHMAGVAAERATDEDLEAMRDAVHDAEFHRCLARAARNPLYALLLDSFGRPAGGAQVLAHQRILERIAARDPAGAREAMHALRAGSIGPEDRLPAAAIAEPCPEVEPAV